MSLLVLHNGINEIVGTTLLPSSHCWLIDDADVFLNLSLFWKGYSMIDMIAVATKGMRSNGEELGLTQSSPQIVASSIIQEVEHHPVAYNSLGFYYHS